MPESIRQLKSDTVNAEVLRGPFDPGGQPDLSGDHPLHLSLFAWNVRSGLSATKAVLSDPPRLRDFWEWPSASKLLKSAEAAGFDSQLQYGMWSGFGGEIGWNDSALDFATAPAAAAAITERLGLLTTFHVGYGVHPLWLAKITSATDHVSGGRLGVNIVASTNANDYAQFGISDKPTREQKYDIADEFTTLLKYLWTSDHPIDFEGKYFQAYGAQVSPRPISSPRPLLMSAAQSDIGFDYAARQCDLMFIASNVTGGSLDEYRTKAEKIHAAAARHGRKIRICAMCYVVMEETDAEAEKKVRWMADEIDREALRNHIIRTGLGPEADLEDRYLGLGKDRYTQFGLGMHGYQLFGSYETVADKLAGLHDAGVGQVALCFFDPHRGVQQVRDHLLPLLRERGLRND